METQSFYFVPCCSEKWNAEGLRSDGNTCDTKFGTMRYRFVPFPYEQANGKHINGTIAFPSEHKTELVCDRSVPV